MDPDTTSIPAPTTGRIVHFFPSGTDADLGTYASSAQPLAAMVTWVWTPTMINLTVFAPAGHTFPRTSIKHGIELEDDSISSYWEWPARS